MAPKRTAKTSSTRPPKRRRTGAAQTRTTRAAALAAIEALHEETPPLRDDANNQQPSMGADQLESSMQVVSTGHQDGRHEHDPILEITPVAPTQVALVSDDSGVRADRFLINRLTTAKELPVFSGDLMEWIHFKKVFELTSNLGKYTDEENMSRLYKALQGEARKKVNALLASGSDVAAVIHTLELHYGNKTVVAQKLQQDLKSLRAVGEQGMSLLQFATDVKNTTTAFQSFKLVGYLHNPELVRAIVKKMPPALQYPYMRFAASQPEEKSALEKLSTFLWEEAELAANSGILELCADFSSSTKEPSTKNSRKPGLVYTIDHEEEEKKATETTETTLAAVDSVRKNACFICKHGKHHPSKCEFFARESVNRRWDAVRRGRLCFICLGSGHSRIGCPSPRCSVCRGPHHSMLHNPAAHNGERGNYPGGAWEAPPPEVQVARASANAAS